MSSRIPEMSGQYDDPAQVETYVTYSRKNITGWIERDFVHFLLKKFGHLSNLHVLDMATGPAWIPIALARVKKDWKFTCVDASVLMLSTAEKNAADVGVKMELFQSHVEKAPLPDQKFDLIINHFSLHEFDNAPAVLLEMERLLKPGGSLVIQDLWRPIAIVQKIMVVLVTIMNMSLKMGEQYKESLRASYRVSEVKRMLASTNLVFSVSIVNRWIGGILRVIASKPISQNP